MFRRTQEPQIPMGSIPLMYVYGKRFHLLPVVVENYRSVIDQITGERVSTRNFYTNEQLRMQGRSICACEHWASKEPMSSVPDIHRLASTNKDCKRKINEFGITPIMLTYIDFLRLSDDEMQEQLNRYQFVYERYWYLASIGKWDAANNTSNVFYPQPE